MTTIAQRLSILRRVLAEAAGEAGRDPAALTLIGVSKRHPADAIRRAAEAGLTDFGENYLQEALPKIDALSDLPLTWHYIGRIQSNKTQALARHFDWVHTVDRVKIAQRLAHARRQELDAGHRNGPLNVCLQVNIDADPNKAGVNEHAITELADAVAGLDGIHCRGLMTILDPTAEPAASFAKLAALKGELGAHRGWDTLSMGMSGDYRQAIAAGATHLRIGTAIFGSREEPQAATEPPPADEEFAR